MPKQVKKKSPAAADGRLPVDENVVDSLPYGLVVVQVDHVITSTNAAARRFLRRARGVRRRSRLRS